MLVQKLPIIIRAPYPPPEHSANAWKISATVGFSIFAILSMLQPFGLSMLNGFEKYLIIAGYGIITFFTVIIFSQVLPILFKKLFDESNWVVWKHALWLTFMVLTIGVVNLLYSHIMFTQFELTFRSLLIFELFTFMIGIFPVTGSIFYSYIKYLKRNLALVELLKNTQQENNLDQKADVIILTGTNKGEHLEIEAQDLLFIKAEGNYVNVHYIVENEQRQLLLRSTLKMILEQTSREKNIIQCHRAYIVNITNIEAAMGNAQGLKLTIKHCSETVPVSRSFVSQVRNVTQL